VIELQAPPARSTFQRGDVEDLDPAPARSDATSMLIVLCAGRTLPSASVIDGESDDGAIGAVRARSARADEKRFGRRSQARRPETTVATGGVA
jgi:hypothetical protein